MTDLREALTGAIKTAIEKKNAEYAQAKANSDKLMTFGYTNEDLCELAHAGDFLTRVDALSDAIKHLADHHEILPAAEALHAIHAMAMGAYNRLAEAAEKADMPQLIAEFDAHGLRRNVARAKGLLERVRAKHDLAKSVQIAL